jgi:hypothetical protein
MEELRCYELKIKDNVDEFKNEVNSVLIYSGIDTIVRKLRGMSIKFHAEPYLDGEIMKNRVIINKGEISIDEEGEKFVYSNRYEISAVIELTGYTLAEVISAFALQYYT